MGSRAVPLHTLPCSGWLPAPGRSDWASSIQGWNLAAPLVHFLSGSLGLLARWVVGLQARQFGSSRICLSHQGRAMLSKAAWLAPDRRWREAGWPCRSPELVPDEERGNLSLWVSSQECLQAAARPAVTGPQTWTSTGTWSPGRELGTAQEARAPPSPAVSAPRSQRAGGQPEKDNAQGQL